MCERRASDFNFMSSILSLAICQLPMSNGLPTLVFKLIPKHCQHRFAYQEFYFSVENKEKRSFVRKT